MDAALAEWEVHSVAAILHAILEEFSGQQSLLRIHVDEWSAIAALADRLNG